MQAQQPKVIVVYVIQKSNKYGLKQVAGVQQANILVVYVIQKSNKYGLKQGHQHVYYRKGCCVCHSKK